MQTRIFQIWLLSLLLSVFPLMYVCADEPDTPGGPDFPPDPGGVYIPPIVVIMGDTITDSDDPGTIPTEIDVNGDGTVVYYPEDNVLTLTGATIESGEDEGAAISYAGSDPLVIEICDSSTIMADTIISSQSDIVLTGTGTLDIVGQVPIIGVPEATIVFDSVYMHVKSVPSAAALRRYIRAWKSGSRNVKFGKWLDETGGPAMSGFGSADFGKVNVSPSGSYGPVTTTDDSGEETTINTYYTEDEDGNVEIVTEFETTPKSGTDALPTTRADHVLDTTQPMYNLLGLRVGATYKGIIVQQGQTFLLK